MRATKILREYRKVVARSGAELVSCSANGHYHLVVRMGDRQKMFVASMSPSDFRSLRQFERDIHRWIKNV